MSEPITEKEFELLVQLPDEDCHDVYYAEGEPAAEFHYPAYYDAVMRVPVSEDKVVAQLKLTRRINSVGATKIGDMFYTGRYWCQRVTY
jgi:hypothetical protein